MYRPARNPRKPKAPLVQRTSKKITPLFGQKFIFFGPFYAGPFYAGLRKLTPIRAGVKRADKVPEYREIPKNPDFLVLWACLRLATNIFALNFFSYDYA